MAAGDVPTNGEKPDLRIGSYRIIQTLGSGGMSSVFRAVHAETGHEVAVKVLPRSLAKNPTSLSRFLREAKSVEALEHPKIVAIYDRGVDQGRHYLVLEYVAGGDLHEWVRAHGAMPIPEAIRVIRDVAEGLGYAAGQGVVHRDIKPANLLMTPEGRIKITDLGLAIQAEVEDERVTREGTTVGTVDYMSPEQARDSRSTTLRSDVYSLGCTFYFLLTGGPPFPGGDVAEKLARHCTAAPPDPRQVRSEIPEALSALVRKMMAKKPDARYQNYDELIAALDRVARPADGPLDAILVDDEEDDDDSGDDDAMVLTLAEPAAQPRSKAAPNPPRQQEISLADLAELDEPPPPTSRRKEPVPRPVEVPKPVAAKARARDEEAIEDEDQESGEFAVTGAMPGAVAGLSGRRMSAAEKSWLKTCIFLGIGLVIVVIAIDQLIRTTRVTEAPPIIGAERSGPTVPEAVVRNIEEGAATPVSKNQSGPMAVPRKTANASGKGKTEKEPEKSVVWVEPADPAPPSVSEQFLGADAERKVRPVWAREELNLRLPGKLIVVRRVPDASDPDQKPSLRTALDVIGGATVEVADDGPFFESDLHFGDSRVIRARPGFRPIVCLIRSRNDSAQQQSAFVEVGEKTLTLDGLDLIMNAVELAPGQDSLFQCSGGTLNLRNCTVTLINLANRTISLFSTGSPDKTSRIRIEGSTLRGEFSAAIDLTNGAADVVVSRTIIFNGQGAVLTGLGSPSATRTVSIDRSILASRGSTLELSEAPRSGRPRPIVVRSLGSTFAHFQSAAKSSVISWRGSNPAAGDIANWQGDHNLFVGWSDLVSVGSSHQVLVSDLSAARSIWPATETNSTDVGNAWPEPDYAAGILPEQLQSLAPNRLDVISRAASPSGYLFSKTVDRFPRVPVPALAEDKSKTNQPGSPSMGMSTMPPRMERSTAAFDSAIKGQRPGSPSGGSGDPRTRPGATVPTAPVKVVSEISPSGVREMTIDAEGPPFMGDIGLILADQVKPTDRLVRLTVTGANQHGWTPYRMPDGVSLEVMVVKDSSGKTPSWSAARGARAGALIETSDASLMLSGVELQRDGSSSLKTLVRVERGHLVLADCRIHGPGSVESGGGNLVEFVSRGTEPLKPPAAPTPAIEPPPARSSPGSPSMPRGKAAAKAGPAFAAAPGIAQPAPVPPPPWPFAKFVDKPTCLMIDTVLITGGEVLDVELGRGLVALERCAIAAGTTAFSLRPGRVARARFEADLWLDRCTVASEKSFVALGPWPGSDPGPDRPWLVSTQNCAFFGSYERPSGTSVLLKADAGSLAHGALFWQASGDGFEVPVFAATGEPSGTTSRRVDVARHWGDLWGEAHMHNISGPHGSGGTASTRLVARLRPGDVEAGDLAIDSSYPPSRRHHAIGVDLKGLRIAPSTRSSRRK